MTHPSLPRSFPRQHARTQRFSLGAPRAFAPAPGGELVAFLRARSGTDREQQLWVLDLAAEGAGDERLVADPAELLGGAEEELSAAERARRERGREGSAGIVAFSVDGAAELAAFALSGRLFTAELRPGAGRSGAEGSGAGRTGGVRELTVPGPVVDPRLSPDGRWIGYVTEGALRVVAASGEGDRAIAEPDGAAVTWGLAEFVAAEEMSRDRGFWWSPDSTALLAARVDESVVRRWWIAEPALPDQTPAQVAYPMAGTPNAEVSLTLFGLDGSRREVEWDRARYPYLAAVHWSKAGPALLLVQTRDQRAQVYLAVDPATGATSRVAADEDRDWLDLFPGVPAWTPDGELVRIADEAGARVLKVGERTLTGPELHVRAVLSTGPGELWVSASAGEGAAEPETGEVHVYRVGAEGCVRVSAEPGVHTAVRVGEVAVLTSQAPDRPGERSHVLRRDADGTSNADSTSSGGGSSSAGRTNNTDSTHNKDTTGSRGLTEIAALASLTETPLLTTRPRLLEAGPRRIPTAVLLPHGYTEGDGPLPVLLDPYGGPHGQRVVAAHDRHLVSQWFADQGFAVVVADGRGTPGRSPAWEKAIAGDFAGVSVEDQVAALHAAAEQFPLDLDRVAVRGWSYGGYLAALAVLRRPDVFHAAVVGAPVTDLRLYDTHYMERYLGHPAERPEVYRANSLVGDDGLIDAAEPVRPMMIVHGLADDNVLVAHSLRLSSALLAAGRPHEMVPLSGVTHMTFSQEDVAENLLLLQVDFLRRSLPRPRG